MRGNVRDVRKPCDSSYFRISPLVLFAEPQLLGLRQPGTRHLDGALEQRCLALARCDDGHMLDGEWKPCASFKQRLGSGSGCAFVYRCRSCQSCFFSLLLSQARGLQHTDRQASTVGCSKIASSKPMFLSASLFVVR